MKHLVVVAHPAESSLTVALARSYAAALQELGDEPQLRDLYRMRFDPLLSAAELHPRAAAAPPDPAIAQAQAEVRSAGAMTFIYPLWWLSMPAMMKGYIDRVFARGFAYESRAGLVHGLLTGKKAVLITLSAAPLEKLIDSGGWQAVQALQETHILRHTGFDLLEHLHFDEVTPDLAASSAERHLTRVRRCAREHFHPH